ncbi:iron-sulfur cluster assembly protein [Algoriphagus boritolerans]|uniref:iron-sulfur cluster assembly protein n=1 Tax=Algoriphagus boritolerans TaxID=308111 RepID=UPI003A0FEF0A
MQLTAESIRKSLSKVQDPDLKRDLVTLGMIQGIHIEGKKSEFQSSPHHPGMSTQRSN